jgi:carbon storage regulator
LISSEEFQNTKTPGTHTEAGDRKDAFMLVLARRENERIVVGDEIVITVVRLANDKVRIGIEAPDHVKVLRTELIEREATDLGEGSQRRPIELSDVLPIGRNDVPRRKTG